MLAIGALAVVAVCSSSCGVKAAGVTGIGVDAAGGLVGYVQMCSDRVDGATLYETDDVTLGRWEAPSPVKDFASWSLREPDGWVAGQGVQPVPGREYSLYGWTTDNQSSSTHVTFRLSDLRDITPGYVLYGDASVHFKRVTEAEFRRTACDSL